MAVFSSVSPMAFVAASATVFKSSVVANNVPVIDPQPIDASINDGGSFTFVSGFTGGDVPVTTQWQISTNNGASWSNIAGGANVSSISASNVPASASGNQYRFIATDNDSDVAISNVVTLTVNSPLWSTATLKLGAGGFVTRSQFRNSGG